MCTYNWKESLWGKYEGIRQLLLQLSNEENIISVGETDSEDNVESLVFTNYESDHYFVLSETES